MNPRDTSALQPRRFSVRRIALLSTALVGLGAAALVLAPNMPAGNYPAAHAQNLTEQAKRLPAPVGFADIVERVKPAVIQVRVEVPGAQTSGMGGVDSESLPPGLREFFKRFGQQGMPQQGGPNARGHGRITGQGSGFFISADGYAVTNNHVVDKAESVQVTTDDGKIHKAKVIGTDPRTDLALIKVEGGGDFPYVKLSDGVPRIGDWVLAVGNPFGLGGTVTAGIVSARGRDIGASAYDDFIQIDAPVNKGNSGGPTFDTEGNVIGVNTAIYSPSGGSVGIAFAIPADTVKSVVKQLRDHGSVTRGWIGVQIQPVTPDIADGLGMKEARGALVSQPQDNSPAAKAGIQAGDVITNVNGEDVKDARDLAKKIGMMVPRTSVRLAVLRDGKEKNVTVTLGEMPALQKQAKNDSDDSGSAEVGKLGLTLAPADRTGSNDSGVVVTGVDPSSVAADHGFSTGDVILEVSGKQVSTPADVRKELNTARNGKKRAVLMRVKSGDNTKFVALPIGRG